MEGKHGKVKRVAVENFLGSLGGLDRHDALDNLYLDARLYGWNQATIEAIEAGIVYYFDGSWTHVLNTL